MSSQSTQARVDLRAFSINRLQQNFWRSFAFFPIWCLSWSHKPDSCGEKKHFRNISYYHIRGAGPLYYIYQGFLSQRFKCHMQVKYKYISASSEQPSSNLFGFIERGMELHVDIGNDSSHSIFESEWMDISFTLGQHWCIRPPVLNNPSRSLSLSLPLSLSRAFGFRLCSLFHRPPAPAWIPLKVYFL